ALQQCVCAVAAKILTGECRVRCGNGSRRGVLSLFEQTHACRSDSRAGAHGRLQPWALTACAAANGSGYRPLLESGVATCSNDRRSAGTPIHASTIAPKIINTAAIKYPINNAVIDPVPMIHPKSSGAPTPPTNVPIA